MNLVTIQQLLNRDAFLLQNARGVAFPKYWYELEGNGEVVWGEYRSSRSSCRTVLDMRFDQPAFKCNCRSRKNPCKHGLALVLLLMEHSDAFRVVQEVPEEISEWLNRRKSRIEPKERTAAEEAQLQAVREKNWSKRLKQMQKGLDELELWLHDVMREGLAAVYDRPDSYWKEWSSYLVDAKLGRLAKRIEQLAHLKKEPNWNELLLAELGDIYLIVRGFHHMESIPIGLKHELFSVVGVNTKKQELQDAEGVKDDWRIVAQHQGTEDNLAYQRTWLWGATNQQFALLLDFAWGSASFEYQWTVGETIEASLVYYPSNFPQRALIKTFQKTEKAIDLNGYFNIDSFLNDYEQAIAQNPWLSTFPVVLEQVIPIIQNDELYLIDQMGIQLPCLSNSPLSQWQLLALSGGVSIKIFGEWDGKKLLPLGAAHLGRWIDFSIYVERNTANYRY